MRCTERAVRYSKKGTPRATAKAEGRIDAIQVQYIMMLGIFLY